jgi:hypothetical protein
VKAYAIASPDYDYTSGGIKVMWGLFGHLLARGYEVYMNRYPTHKEFVGVYPEILHGNTMNAPVVARYVLNKPGVMGIRAYDQQIVPGPNKFDEREIQFYFSRIFGEAENYMFLPIINLDIFRNTGKKRTKTAYFVGKGTDLGLHKKDSIEINRAVAADQQHLADILNECLVIYQYDPISAMSEIARLCGCRVVLLNGQYSKQDYLKYEPGVNGISFGSDTKEELDANAFRDTYLGLGETFNRALDKFIEVTQNA